MKNVKYICSKSLLGIVTIALITFEGCGDETTNPNDTHPSELLGTWAFSDGVVSTVITTNSFQSFPDPTSEGTGSIKIKGAHDVDLKYLSWPLVNRCPFNIILVFSFLSVIPIMSFR